MKNIETDFSSNIGNSIIPMQPTPSSTTHKKTTVREYDLEGRMVKETIAEETTTYSNGGALPGAVWVSDHTNLPGIKHFDDGFNTRLG